MIISASRRTDIPAFYSEWFMRRIHQQYCLCVNPFNRHQVTQVSLQPEDVDALVFWTKNAEPLLLRLPELDARGYRYYFQYTLNGYGELFEPNLPELERCIETFLQLSERIGSERIIWLKGDGRPINSVEDRAEVLAGLRSIDHVVIFNDSTAEELVRQLKPDIYVKGGDYSLDRLPEAAIVAAYAGKTVLVPMVEGRSTSSPDIRSTCGPASIR